MTLARPVFGLACALVCATVGGCGDDTDNGATATHDSGPPPRSATAFCDAYEPLCGYGTPNHYADRNACETEYAAYTDNRKLCVNDKLELANADPGMPCDGASGKPPCGAY